MQTEPTLESLNSALNAIKDKLWDIVCESSPPELSKEQREKIYSLSVWANNVKANIKKISSNSARES